MRSFETTAATLALVATAALTGMLGCVAQPADEGSPEDAVGVTQAADQSIGENAAAGQSEATTMPPAEAPANIPVTGNISLYTAGGAINVPVGAQGNASDEGAANAAQHDEGAGEEPPPAPAPATGALPGVGCGLPAVGCGLPAVGCALPVVGCACVPPIHGGPVPIGFGGLPEPGLPGGFLYVRQGFSGAYVGIPVRPGFGTCL